MLLAQRIKSSCYDAHKLREKIKSPEIESGKILFQVFDSKLKNFGKISFQGHSRNKVCSISKDHHEIDYDINGNIFFLKNLHTNLIPSVAQ